MQGLRFRAVRFRERRWLGEQCPGVGVSSQLISSATRPMPGSPGTHGALGLVVSTVQADVQATAWGQRLYARISHNGCLSRGTFVDHGGFGARDLGLYSPVTQMVETWIAR